jgi:hypothetical protein
MGSSPNSARSESRGRIRAVLIAGLVVLGVVTGIGVYLLAVTRQQTPGYLELVYEPFPPDVGVPLRTTANTSGIPDTWAVRGGRLVQVSWRNGGVVVTAGGLRERPHRILYSDATSGNQGQTWWRVDTDSEGGVWLEQFLARRMGPPRPRVTRLQPGTLREEIEYRLPAAPLPAAGRSGPRTLRVGAWSPRGAQAYFVPFAGQGRAVNLVPESVKNKPALITRVGETVFWCESSSDEEFVYETLSSSPRPTLTTTVLLPAKTTLYCRAPSDSISRLMASGLTFPKALVRLQDGIALYQPHPYPSKGSDLLVCRAPDFRPVRFADFRGDHLVQLGDKLWWIERDATTKEFYQATYYLGCADANGSGKRRLIPLTADADGARIGGGTFSLQAAEGRLIFGYTAIQSAQASLDSRLALVDPATGRLSKPFVHGLRDANPSNEGCVDGGYYYFVRKEARRSRFDVLMERGTEKLVTCLFRVRLPAPEEISPPASGSPTP